MGDVNTGYDDINTVEDVRLGQPSVPAIYIQRRKVTVSSRLDDNTSLSHINSRQTCLCTPKIRGNVTNRQYKKEQLTYQVG